MALSPKTLRSALADCPPAAGDWVEVGKEVAQRVCAALEAESAASAIVDIHSWAFNVEFVLQNGDHWAIECLSPNDFRMYPGFQSGDEIVWPNVWVRDNMTLDELVKNINDVAFRATEEEFENA